MIKQAAQQSCNVSIGNWFCGFSRHYFTPLCLSSITLLSPLIASLPISIFSWKLHAPFHWHGCWRTVQMYQGNRSNWGCFLLSMPLPSAPFSFFHQCDAPTPCFPECFLPSCDFTFQKLKGSLMLSTSFSSADTETHRAWISDTHMHTCMPTHREQRFAALEMLPLLQIYSLKHERFPSRSIPGGC